MKDKTNYCYNRARTYLYEAQRGIEFVMSIYPDLFSSQSPGI